MTDSEKVVGGRFGQGGRLRQVPLDVTVVYNVPHFMVV